MADCTKTVDFLREWKRMCDGTICHRCGIGEANDSVTMSCRRYVMTYPEDAIDIVQKWSDEHPVMTWAGKLRELLPNFTGMPHNYCPSLFFGNHAPSGRGDCNDIACVDCWNGEYKEPKA